MRTCFRKSRRLFFTILWATAIFGTAGCSPTQTALKQIPAADPYQEFETQIDQLLADLLVSQQHHPAQLSPAAVMPGSLKTGQPFTRLEELVMERLKLKLRQQQPICHLSRQDWLAYQEGLPLAAHAAASEKSAYGRHLVIYEVRVVPDEHLQQAGLHITAASASGKALVGILAQTVLYFGPEAPARELYSAQPLHNPFRRGLEEKPYTSIDRLAFSLVSELKEVYAHSIKVGFQEVSQRDMQVLFYAPQQAPPNIRRDLYRAIRQSIQQRLIESGGIQSVLSREDFPLVAEQLAFYQKNHRQFEAMRELFKVGTIFLLLDCQRHPDGRKIGVSLRGVWSLSPLETAQEGLIVENYAGTYLSGFTAKAYLALNRAMDSGLAGAGMSSTKKKVNGLKAYPGAHHRNYQVCFYDFGFSFDQQVYPLLVRLKQIKRLERQDQLCEQADDCHCYQIGYQGGPEQLNQLLRSQLKTSEVLSFELVVKNHHQMNLVHDSGFK